MKTGLRNGIVDSLRHLGRNTWSKCGTVDPTLRVSIVGPHTMSGLVDCSLNPWATHRILVILESFLEVTLSSKFWDHNWR